MWNIVSVFENSLITRTQRVNRKSNLVKTTRFFIRYAQGQKNGKPNNFKSLGARKQFCLNISKIQ